MGGTYLNYYQNVIVSESNKLANSFNTIRNSPALQNHLLGKNNPLLENSKSQLFNGLVNRETSEIGQTVGQALLTAGAVVSGVGTAFSLWSLMSSVKNIINIGVYAVNGLKIAGFTGHGVNRAIGSMGRNGVSPEAILDALKRPLKIGNIVIDQTGRQSQRFIGRFGEVVVPPQKKVVR